VNKLTTLLMTLGDSLWDMMLIVGRVKSVVVLVGDEIVLSFPDDLNVGVDEAVRVDDNGGVTLNPDKLLFVII
jgi:hypothetical protein